MSNRAHRSSRKGYIPFVLVVGLEADEFPTTGPSPSYTHTSTRHFTVKFVLPWGLELCCYPVADWVWRVHLQERCSKYSFVVSHFSVFSCSSVCRCLDGCSLPSSLFTVILHLKGFWVFLFVLKIVSIQSVFWPNLQVLCSLSALCCSLQFPPLSSFVSHLCACPITSP